MHLPLEIGDLIARRATYASPVPKFDFFTAFAIVYPDTANTTTIQRLLRFTTASEAQGIELLDVARRAWDAVNVTRKYDATYAEKAPAVKIAADVVKYDLDVLLRYTYSVVDSRYEYMHNEVLYECAKQKKLRRSMRYSFGTRNLPNTLDPTRLFRTDDDRFNKKMMCHLDIISPLKSGKLASVFEQFLLSTTSLDSIASFVRTNPWYNVPHQAAIGIKSNTARIKLIGSGALVDRLYWAESSIYCRNDEEHMLVVLQVARRQLANHQPLVHPLVWWALPYNTIPEETRRQQKWWWYKFTFRKGTDVFDRPHHAAREFFARQVCKEARIPVGSAKMATEFGVDAAEWATFYDTYLVHYDRTCACTLKRTRSPQRDPVVYPREVPWRPHEPK